MEMDELGTPVSLVIQDLARQAARGPSEGVDSAVSEQEPQALYATQAIRASRARGRLVIQWRAACRPRGQGAIPAVPPCDCASSPPLFEQWLHARSLADALRYEREESGWSVYRLTRLPVVTPHSNGQEWRRAFHGIFWYATWLILETGVLLESCDGSLGLRK